MEKTIENLLDTMWTDYIKLNPQAQKIVDLLETRGDKVINDHIALRTFAHPKVSIDVLAKPFIDCGYRYGGDYHFEEKKLYAKHFIHEDKSLPKIFISELLIENFSKEFQSLVNGIIDQLDDNIVTRFDFTCSGKNWNVSSHEYELLKKESEYAAWMSSIGYRPNHFTVFINELKSFKGLNDLNIFLKENNFKMNESGGLVKGTPEVFLEQSSTLADSIEVEFSDKKEIIPSCYFEFAKRYPMENGELYQGFVAKSADKIFESTDKAQ